MPTSRCSSPRRAFRVFVHPTTKFKTITSRSTSTSRWATTLPALALLPHVLRRGCKGLPDMRSIVIFLEDLYGASMGADIAKIGERQMVCSASRW